MILTGPLIRASIASGQDNHGKPVRFRSHGGSGEMMDSVETYDSMDFIHVDPHDPELVGPNSIDLRLHEDLLVYETGARAHYEADRAGSATMDVYIPPPPPLDMRADNNTHTMKIPEEGLILYPGVLYLGRTIECIGSNCFVPIVEGRSSVGRLGISVHVTAGFCDLGFKGTITLEMHVIHPVKIYPNVPICQAYFLKPEGTIELYKGRYQGQLEPTASRFGQPVEKDAKQ